MKLLFDENLSPRVAAAFLAEYPGSTHVHLAGLGSAADDEVWRYARENGFTIVTKDAGFPPKVVWIRLGNVSTDQIEGALRANREAMERLEGDPELAALIV